MQRSLAVGMLALVSVAVGTLILASIAVTPAGPLGPSAPRPVSLTVFTDFGG